MIGMTDSTQIVQKLWNYCNILRDDGLSYGDYVEQLSPRTCGDRTVHGCKSCPPHQARFAPMR